MLKSSTMISNGKNVLSLFWKSLHPLHVFYVGLCRSLFVSVYLFLFCLSFVCPLLQNDLDDPERGMIFVCSATHKTKSMFFFLAQTEQGDIFKVTLETDEEMVSKHEGRIKSILALSRYRRCCTLVIPPKQRRSISY